MAEKLDSFTFRKGGARPKEYPWKEWTDGAAWKITPGQDFDVKPTSMVVTLYEHSKKNGYQVQTQRVGPNKEEIVFRFTKDPESGDPEVT